jgi:hypothetical protein
MPMQIRQDDRRGVGAETTVASGVIARILSFAILLSLAADLLLKDLANLQQAFWACYWAATLVAAGILIRSDRMVSWGVVFFTGVGVPAWVMGRLMAARVDPTSVLIHILPLLAGAAYLFHKTTLPRASAAGAWFLYLVPTGMAWIFCDPAEHINLTHYSWPPLAGIFPQPWEFQIFLLAASLVTVTLSARVIHYGLGRRPYSGWRNPVGNLNRLSHS